MRLSRLLVASLMLAGCASGTAQPAANRPAIEMTPYRHEADGYVIAYPKDWTVQEHASLPTLNRLSDGTAFIPPVQSGTSLKDAMVFVETTDGECPVFDPPLRETISDQAFAKGGFQSIGSGERYEGTMYALQHDDRCITATLYLQSCFPMASCPSGRRKEADTSALRVAFGRMLRSLATP